MAEPVMHITIDLTDEAEVRRASELLREMARKIRENPPQEPIDPALLDDIRRGAEHFERARKMARNAASTACPKCGRSVAMERIDDLNVCEYRATCQACGWSGVLRDLICGGCHGHQIFEWTGDSWRCLRCSRVRGGTLPPRGLEAGG